MARSVPLGKVIGLGVGLLVAVAYTLSAFDMPMQSGMGTIGAGFFPRWIGSLLIVTLGAALLQTLISGDKGDAGEGGNLPIVAGFIAATAVLIALFLTIPWPLAVAIFLFGALAWLNRGRWITNTIISVLVPLFFYFLLGVWLQATLP